MDTKGPLGQARPIMDTMGPLGQARPTMNNMGPPSIRTGQTHYGYYATMGPLEQGRPTNHYGHYANILGHQNCSLL